MGPFPAFFIYFTGCFFGFVVDDKFREKAMKPLNEMSQKMQKMTQRN